MCIVNRLKTKIRFLHTSSRVSSPHTDVRDIVLQSIEEYERIHTRPVFRDPGLPNYDKLANKVKDGEYFYELVTKEFIVKHSKASQIDRFNEELKESVMSQIQADNSEIKSEIIERIIREKLYPKLPEHLEHQGEMDIIEASWRETVEREGNKAFLKYYDTDTGYDSTDSNSSGAPSGEEGSSLGGMNAKLFESLKRKLSISRDSEEEARRKIGKWVEETAESSKSAQQPTKNSFWEVVVEKKAAKELGDTSFLDNVAAKRASQGAVNPKSTIDYILEKKALEMPDITDADGGGD